MPTSKALLHKSHRFFQQNKEFYQEKQQRIAEEHLQAAAEIGRTSNISLEKLTELLALFYQEGE